MEPLEQALHEVADAKTVVVVPDSESDAQTPSDLASSLKTDDQIVLVMLPEAKGLPSCDEVAQEVAESAGGHKVVGVAIGREVCGYSDLIDQQVPSDLMGRSESLNNATDDTLSMYADLVHQYQATDEGREEMGAVTEANPAPADNGHGAIVPVASSALVIAVLAAVAWTLIRRKRTPGKRALDAPLREQSPQGRIEVMAERLQKGAAAVLPAPEAKRVRTLISHLQEAVGEWDSISQTPEIAYEVEQIITEYLPDLLRMYRDIPKDMRGTRYREGGLTPTESIRDQIEVMDKRVMEIREAAFQGKVSALEVQSRFLHDKYREGTLDLGH